MYDAYLEARREEILGRLAELVAIPSVSITGEGIDRAVGFLEADLKRRGFEVEVHDTAGHPIVSATLGPENAPRTLLIYGHYDVFPAEDREQWRTDPFEAVIDGDRIYGRGTGDNKGQMLAHLEAAEMVKHHHGELPVRLRLILEGEEETGSKNLPVFIREHRDALSADLCVYSDGPMFPGDQPVLLLGVRGALCFELLARGAKRVLHSGNFGGVAPKPALDLVRLLAEMVDEHGEILVPGALDGVPEPTAEEREALRHLPFDREGMEREMGVPPLDGSPQEAFERLLLKPAFNLASISAGFLGEGIKPVIPHQAVAKVDLRLVGDQDPDAVFEAIRRWIRQRGYTSIECRKLIGQPPSKTPFDCPFIPTVRAAVARGFGREPLLVPSLAATTPDYVFTKLLGIPSIVVPFAPYDENNHAPNESTKLSSFFSGIKSSAYLLESLAAGAGDVSDTAARTEPTIDQEKVS